ncbi:MAG: hypothetical protein WC807_02570 [Hyphomicrobium sp.]
MPDEHVRRGRPKGSGLDDRVQLTNIARMLAADPALKPTTAIKLAGVTDPSTIRRLRDKLRQQVDAPQARASGPYSTAEVRAADGFSAPHLLAAEAAPRFAQPQPWSQPVAAASVACRHVAEPALRAAAPLAVPAVAAALMAPPVPLPPDSLPPSDEPAASLVAGPDLTSAASPAQPEEASWLTHWYALSLHALAATVEAQMGVVGEMLRVPPVACVLKQQVLLNEVAKAFCPTTRDDQTSTKSLT